MEGSVKSLIEAEEEARLIVEQANKEKKEMAKNAQTQAFQIVNKKEADLKVKYEEAV